MSDYYFEVGELEFPKGRAREWLAVVLAEKDRDAEDRRTVELLFETLEGDVDVKLTHDRFVARILLIDGAYFQDQGALRMALDAAAKAGATGAWFSGSDRSGDRSTFAGGKRKVTEVDGGEFSEWIVEAGNVLERNASPPATKRPAAKAKKKRPTLKKAAKKAAPKAKKKPKR